MPLNQQLLLDNRPVGEATASNFKLVSTNTPELEDGQVLVQHHFLSLDPYMRMRMNDSKSYAAPQALGEVMIGGTAGEVVESRSATHHDLTQGLGRCITFAVVHTHAHVRIQAQKVMLHQHLSIF